MRKNVTNIDVCITPSKFILNQKVAFSPLIVDEKYKCPICHEIQKTFCIHPDEKANGTFKPFYIKKGVNKCPICGINLNWEKIYEIS